MIIHVTFGNVLSHQTLLLETAHASTGFSMEPYRLLDPLYSYFCQLQAFEAGNRLEEDFTSALRSQWC